MCRSQLLHMQMLNLLRRGQAEQEGVIFLSSYREYQVKRIGTFQHNSLVSAFITDASS